jgi:hypothetical protein
VSDPQPRHTPLWLGLAALALVLLPCLYVGSIGPVVRYADSPRLESTWMVVYAPLEWAHDHTFLHAPLELYVGLWMELPGRGD